MSFFFSMMKNKRNRMRRIMNWKWNWTNINEVFSYFPFSIKSNLRLFPLSGMPFCWQLDAGCWLHSDRHRTKYAGWKAFTCQFYAYHKCKHSQSEIFCFHKISTSDEKIKKTWRKKTLTHAVFGMVQCTKYFQNIFIYLECEENFPE